MLPRPGRRGRGRRGGRASGPSRQEVAMLNQAVSIITGNSTSPATPSPPTRGRGRGRGRGGRGRGRGRGGASSISEKRPVGRPRKNATTPNRPPASSSAATLAQQTYISSSGTSSATATPNIGMTCAASKNGSQMLGEDGVHSITVMTQASASAATAIIQKVVGDSMDDQKLTPGSSGGVDGAGGRLPASQGSSTLPGVLPPPLLATNLPPQTSTRRRKRKSVGQTTPSAPPTKRPRGRPKGSGAKKPSIATAPSSLQDVAVLSVPQKRRGRRPKMLMPKPPPLQKIVESNVPSGSQGNSLAVNYGVQPSVGSNDQILANVSSVNVMIPAATPTMQVQDGSALQGAGGKKRVRNEFLTSVISETFTVSNLHPSSNKQSC